MKPGCRDMAFIHLSRVAEDNSASRPGLAVSRMFKVIMEIAPHTLPTVATGTSPYAVAWKRMVSHVPEGVNDTSKERVVGTFQSPRSAPIYMQQNIRKVFLYSPCLN